ncbi:hypothetical protein E2C01_049288 [Portunus trituberculatus]|uniref:Uncharacterized protein n=1 Tax=Portunus trituberculatus TaxID=210409 RepID=A0A5B7GDB3_PORTR|nr:hypothetical protein [Portunus trituberculatus]
MSGKDKLLLVVVYNGSPRTPSRGRSHPPTPHSAGGYDASGPPGSVGGTLKPSSSFVGCKNAHWDTQDSALRDVVYASCRSGLASPPRPSLSVCVVVVTHSLIYPLVVRNSEIENREKVRDRDREEYDRAPINPYTTK